MHVWYVIPAIVCENDENATNWALVQLFCHTTTAVPLWQAFVGQHKSFPRSVTQMSLSSPLHFILMVGEKVWMEMKGNKFIFCMWWRTNDEHGTIIITFRWNLYCFTFGEKLSSLNVRVNFWWLFRRVTTSVGEEENLQFARCFDFTSSLRSFKFRIIELIIFYVLFYDWPIKSSCQSGTYPQRVQSNWRGRRTAKRKKTQRKTRAILDVSMI